MLYSIIPPVLVVLSLAGIIIFLVKKAPKIKKLPSQPDNVQKAQRKNFSPRFFFKKDKNEEFSEFSRRKVSWLKGRAENISRIGGRLKKKEKDPESEKVVEIKIQSPKIQIMPKVQEQQRKFERPLIKEKTLGKKDLFEKILVERIASNPKDIEAYERLGEYYLEIENWEYAKECFKQVIKLNPGDFKAKTKMRKLEKLLGE